MLRINESSGTRKKLLSATTLQREQFGRHQRKEAARHVSRPSINNSLRNFWGKRKTQKLIGFCLHSIAHIDTSVKEGTSAKYRTRPSACSLAETSPMAKGKTMKMWCKEYGSEPSKFIGLQKELLRRSTRSEIDFSRQDFGQEKYDIREDIKSCGFTPHFGEIIN